MQRTAFQVTQISTPAGKLLEVAQPNDLVHLKLPPHVRAGDLLRREKKKPS
jgi:hypothetical protein